MPQPEDRQVEKSHQLPEYIKAKGFESCWTYNSLNVSAPLDGGCAREAHHRAVVVHHHCE